MEIRTEMNTMEFRPSLKAIPKPRVHKKVDSSYYNPEWNNSGPEDMLPVNTGSAGVAGELDQDTVAIDAPFVISVNGTTSETEGGGEVQDNNFNIRVQGGTMKWFKANPLTVETKTERVSIGAEESKLWLVYAKWKVTRQIGEQVFSLPSELSIQIDEVEATSDSFRTYEPITPSVYQIYEKLGYVRATRKPNSTVKRFVINIEQTRVGNIVIGDENGEPADTNGADTRSGLRTVTICINGEPYNADLDLKNIVKVEA